MSLFSKSTDRTYSYRLGTHADQVEGEDTAKYLRDVFESNMCVTLKRMSQGQRDKYIDIMGNSGKTPASTMRREVGKWVADVSGVTYIEDGNEKPFDDAAHFMRELPPQLITDLHYELMRVPSTGN